VVSWKMKVPSREVAISVRLSGIAALWNQDHMCKAVGCISRHVFDTLRMDHSSSL
jgi:hypothetical protein